jgi:16S rRNA (cytidine1402-2'-O)-methyltransferase
MTGALYLIPVPIANEEDNSTLVYPLLKDTVNNLSEFIVEDLKTARRSLRKIGFIGDFDKMVFHVLNEHTDIKSISSFLTSAEKGKNIGLLSEAGMPCIADPGSDVVRLAHRLNIKVVPLYGQSSIFLALAASGLNGQNFFFHGYLPKEQGSRIKKLKEIEKKEGAQIFIETPYRNNHLLSDIISVCSADVLLCIAVNITGLSEMVITKTIIEWRGTILPDLNKQPTVFLLGK